MRMKTLEFIRIEDPKIFYLYLENEYKNEICGKIISACSGQSRNFIGVDELEESLIYLKQRAVELRSSTCGFYSHTNIQYQGCLFVVELLYQQNNTIQGIVRGPFPEGMKCFKSCQQLEQFLKLTQNPKNKVVSIGRSKDTNSRKSMRQKQ